MWEKVGRFPGEHQFPQVPYCQGKLLWLGKHKRFQGHLEVPPAIPSFL